MPTFNPVDLRAYADSGFDGDLERAAVSLIRNAGPAKYKPASAYANAKLFVAWWAAALSRRLPDGMTVNAVSPGSAPGTGAARLGMAAEVPVAASRYIEASEFSGDVTGEFFASVPKKMTGPLHRVELSHVVDRASQDAAWAATVEVAGMGYPEAQSA